MSFQLSVRKQEPIGCVHRAAWLALRDAAGRFSEAAGLCVLPSTGVSSLFCSAHSARCERATHRAFCFITALSRYHSCAVTFTFLKWTAQRFSMFTKCATPPMSNFRALSRPQKETARHLQPLAVSSPFYPPLPPPHASGSH